VATDVLGGHARRVKERLELCEISRMRYSNQIVEIEVRVLVF
jgi:hypothetical protein